MIDICALEVGDYVLTSQGTGLITGFSVKEKMPRQLYVKLDGQKQPQLFLLEDLLSILSHR